MNLLDICNAPEEMQPRLNKQCQAILERLKQGTVTNRELADIALKYTGRISELRKAGYYVGIVSHNKKSGLVTYRLMQ